MSQKTQPMVYRSKETRPPWIREVARETSIERRREPANDRQLAIENEPEPWHVPANDRIRRERVGRGTAALLRLVSWLALAAAVALTIRALTA